MLAGIVNGMNVGEAVKQEVTLCYELELVREFAYLGDRMSACEGCEAAVTAGTICWWVKFRECGELLYGRKFPLKQKGAVCKSYVRPAVMCRDEACFLKESEMAI